MKTYQMNLMIVKKKKKIQQKLKVYQYYIRQNWCFYDKLIVL